MPSRNEIRENPGVHSKPPGFFLLEMKKGLSRRDSSMVEPPIVYRDRRAFESRPRRQLVEYLTQTWER